MAELKTKQTEQSVDAYIDAIADDVRRQDCRTLIELMSKATAAEPRMWGTSMVGFGSYHYKYDSGHEGDAMLTGFASRKPDLTLYVMPGFEGHEPLLARLGQAQGGQGLPLREASCRHRSRGPLRARHTFGREAQAALQLTGARPYGRDQDGASGSLIGRGGCRPRRASDR